MRQIIYFLLFALTLTLVSCNGGKTVVEDAKTTTEDVVTSSVDLDTPPGKISFAAANDRYSADGTFKRWNFTHVSIEENDLATLHADIDIDLTSIWEKSDGLTEHLKANDYFDVAKYTTAKLTIRNVHSHGEDNHAELTLSMRDQKQELQSTFQVINQNPLTVKGTAEVDRSIFGIGVENKKVPDMITVTYETVIPR